MHKRLIQSKRGGAFVNNIRENQNKCDTLAKEIKWIFVRDTKMLISDNTKLYC